jgi:hypothetical protein
MHAHAAVLALVVVAPSWSGPGTAAATVSPPASASRGQGLGSSAGDGEDESSAISVGWPNSTEGVHTFLTFDSASLVHALRGNPSDPRAATLDFVWGGGESAISVYTAANPATQVSKYIPCCRDTQLQKYGEAAIKNYTGRGWGDRVLYTCDRKTPAYYDHGGAGRASHLSLPVDFSNHAVVAWQAGLAQQAAALGYDALALDNTELENAWGACGVWRTPTEWVQLYNGSVLDAAFQSAVADWLSALKAKVNQLTTKRGQPMKIIPNFRCTCLPVHQQTPVAVHT